MVLGILPLAVVRPAFRRRAALIVANAITIVLAGGILWMKLKYG
jgi:MtN3 and saliva related transmembrane protein